MWEKPRSAPSISNGGFPSLYKSIGVYSGDFRKKNDEPPYPRLSTTNRKIYTFSMAGKIYKFQAEIRKVPNIDGAYIVFPYDIKKEFGKGRIKVHAEFDGEPYDGSVVNMGIKNDDGSICYIIGILKSIREKINKQAGDIISVKITERQ